jgi:hypothetical protein
MRIYHSIASGSKEEAGSEARRKIMVIECAISLLACAIVRGSPQVYPRPLRH